MPKIIVEYKDKRTLEALHDFSKYFDFEISSLGFNEGDSKQSKINGLTIVNGDNSIDTTELSEVFSGKNIDAAELRNTAWQRSK